jgi:hypothetical protein
MRAETALAVEVNGHWCGGIGYGLYTGHK